MSKDHSSHSQFEEVYRGHSSSMKCENLSSGRSYSFRVQAFNEAGTSAFSLSSSFSTKASAPDSPTNLECTSLSSTSIKMSWHPPYHSGGVRITRYNLFVCEEGKSEGQIITVPGTKKTISKLQSLTTYSVRVQAQNPLGKGKFSDVFLITTPGSPPDSPERPVIVPQRKTES
eukprot:TRINITY_DN1866_c1_g1_i1.p2 TRINITY_DN1866_c1_g1~~TRINITY_DN1866_c1_g1_i1.p2  ORF type:complete len:173 (+),score=31.06 TRINITY_DN1866_c1_g1_i1:1262-1780(+)